MKYFDKWLKEEMKAQKLTRQDVADITGYSKSAVRLWELGIQIPRYDALVTCVEALGYEIKVQKKGK